MNVIKSREIAEKIAELKAISSAFAATYGTAYHLQEDSSTHAIELYRRSMTIQTTIASYLHPQALNGAYSRYGAWWDRYDMIPSSIVNEMATTSFELIGRCAYTEDPKTGDIAIHNTLVLEQDIAGMLHPSTIISELEHEHVTLEEVS